MYIDLTSRCAAVGKTDLCPKFVLTKTSRSALFSSKLKFDCEVARQLWNADVERQMTFLAQTELMMRVCMHVVVKK